MRGTEDRRFGALLRAHRVAAGLSQEELAERARLSRRTVTDLERGVTTAPYRETVALLADALDLTEEDRAELENAVDRARTPPTAEHRGRAASGGLTSSGVDPLLATKLAIPPARSVLIPRPHLMERLRAGMHGSLTLLSAPAGSGKTTLLSAWRTIPEGQKTPLAWISLDEGDNDPTRFWRYVLTALDRVVASVGTAALALLHSADAPSIETVLIALVNALTAQAEDVVLILDDYHVIEAEPIHRMLAFLLGHRPPSLHLLLATRADPPLPLARLRARGELAELRAADLRFTREETAVFLSRVMRITLSSDEVAALEARTEGWGCRSAAGQAVLARAVRRERRRHPRGLRGAASPGSGRHHGRRPLAREHEDTRGSAKIRAHPSGLRPRIRASGDRTRSGKALCSMAAPM